jgi:hypothetical protein
MGRGLKYRYFDKMRHAPLYGGDQKDSRLLNLIHCKARKENLILCFEQHAHQIRYAMSLVVAITLNVGAGP